MAKLFNDVGVSIATAGTGTVTFGAAIDDSYFTPTEAGVVDGDVVTYKLSEGTNIEIGRGTVGGSITTMSRDTVLRSKVGGTAGTTKITLLGTAELRIVAAAEDYIAPDLIANGLVTRTAEDAYTSRTITGTANEVEVTQGDGVAGNPTIGLPATIAVTTIELGAATDTTLARINPGVVTIEGVTIATSSNTLTLTNKIFDANATGNSITNIEAADIAAAALVTAADTIATNDNDTSWPTTAAVIDYVATAGGAQTPWTSNIDANLFNLLFDDNTGILDQAGNEQLIFQSTATAVNFWEMTNSAANGVQRLSVAGTDAAIAITIASKSTDPINFEVNAANAAVVTATAFTPGTDGAQALGTTALAWNDLFLDTGATINIEAGNWLATHTTGILTVTTGDLRVTNNFTNATSVATLAGAQTLTNKTISHASNTITGTIAQFNTGLTDGDFVTLPTGSGALPADPNADRMVFWDDSAAALTYLAPGTTLAITTTTIDVVASSPTVAGVAEIATAAEYRTGTDATRHLGVAETWAAAANVTLTDAATVAVDMATFINGTVTLAGNRTLGQPSNTKVGQSGFIRIIQDATGSRTLAYHADWKFAGGTDPVLTTTASATDVLFYTVVAANYIVAHLHKATA